MTTIRQIAIAAAITASLSMASTSSFAFSAEAQQLCTGDAFRLCSSDIPDVSKVTVCMVKHRAELSTGCRSYMDREAARRSNKLAAN